VAGLSPEKRKERKPEARGRGTNLISSLITKILFQPLFQDMLKDIVFNCCDDAHFLFLMMCGRSLEDALAYCDQGCHTLCIEI
jgi:hypothetical protein